MRIVFKYRGVPLPDVLSSRENRIFDIVKENDGEIVANSYLPETNERRLFADIPDSAEDAIRRRFARTTIKVEEYTKETL